jgi:glutamate 5-kinase
MLYNRIVAKLGTNLLTGGTNRLNRNIISDLAQQIAQLHKYGREIIIVSSGAVAAGRQKLGHRGEQRDIHFKQVLASVGQSHLMHIYEQIFSKL